MAHARALTRQTDSKGRVTLGEAFKNRTVLVEQHGDEVRVRLARVIPEGEAWLYENEKALGAVRRGLKQAKAGQFAKTASDLNAARALADQLQDD